MIWSVWAIRESGFSAMHDQWDKQGRASRMGLHRDSQSHSTACVCVHVCACVSRMSEKSCSICAMHLALKRVVICKSPLPWAGGVKLGRGDREELGRDGKTETDRDGMWMTGVSVKERVESECESGLYYITDSTRKRWTALENIHDCTSSCVMQDPTKPDKYSKILYIFSSGLISAKDFCCYSYKSNQLKWALS